MSDLNAIIDLHQELQILLKGNAKGSRKYPFLAQSGPFNIHEEQQRVLTATNRKEEKKLYKKKLIIKKWFGLLFLLGHCKNFL